jgi:hypothetical protein
MTEFVRKIAYVPTNNDYYKSWDAVLNAVDRFSIWMKSQSEKITAHQFRNTHKKGHSLKLSTKRGEKFAANALSNDRTWDLIRKIGIDKAMKSKLDKAAEGGRPRIFNDRQSELWAMDFNRQQNTTNTTITSYVNEQVSNDPFLVGHSRTLMRAIRSKSVRTSRTVIPNLKPPKVFYIIYFLFFFYFFFCTEVPNNELKLTIFSHSTKPNF